MMSNHTDLRIYTEKFTAPFPKHIKDALALVGCKKRTCIFHVEDVAPRTLYSYWDEGSRDYYRAFDKHNRAINLPIGGAPGFTPDPRPWVPNPGDILIATSVFRGKEGIPVITFYR